MGELIPIILGASLIIPGWVWMIVPGRRETGGGLTLNTWCEDLCRLLIG